MKSTLVLRNPRRPEVEPLEVEALADSGAAFLVPYVGPIEVRFKNRVGFTGAIVIGDPALVGAIPMEELTWSSSPARKRSTSILPARICRLRL